MEFSIGPRRTGARRSSRAGAETALRPLIMSPAGQRPAKRPSIAPKGGSILAGTRKTPRFPVRPAAPVSPASSAPLGLSESPISRGSRSRSAGLGIGRRLADIARALESGIGPGSPLLSNPQRVAILSAVFGGIALFLGLTAGIVVLSERAFPRVAGTEGPLGGLAGADLLSLLEAGRPDDGSDGGVDLAAPDISPALDVREYVLQKGDTIDSVARRYGLRRDSIISMNGISNVKRIKAGSRLKLPNQDGVIHVVAAGDSLNAIAKRYKVGVNALLDANSLDSYVLKSGQSLFVPGGKLDGALLREALGDLFGWPVRGRITSPWGYRIDPIAHVRRFHYGLDIMGAEGTRINAALDGRVVDSGYNGNFGNYVILAHSGGFQTAYAHLSAISVKKGESVGRGQKIGEMGNTGYSTGTHLHFSVYRNGKAMNPGNYLSK
jgi:murein DD-endopeptidase MepM/ murein hydrolase activator NlpD